MSRVVRVATEDVRIPVARVVVERVAQAVLRAERVPRADLSITFVSNRRIARLNREHLAHRGPTDVITFGFAPATADAPLTGDVYIAPEVSSANARAHKEPVRRELLRLVVHGVLHVIGHEHPEGGDRYDSAMWRRQEALLARELGRA